MPKPEKLTLNNICSGAAAEVFSHELAKLLENVADPNTEAEKARITIEGREYADKALVSITEPQPNKINVVSLQGFCDLLRERVEGFDAKDFLVHVESHEQVSLIARQSDKWGRRAVLISAQPVKTGAFQFGQYQKHDPFIVGVLAHFDKTDDRDYIVRVAASITAGAERTSEDDGITQKVSTRAGMALKTTEALRNRVVLAPFRSFPEVIHQNFASEFIFWVRGGSDDQAPELALFEADGGKWKIAAINEVRRWLAVQVTDIPVIA